MGLFDRFSGEDDSDSEEKSVGGNSQSRLEFPGEKPTPGGSGMDAGVSAVVRDGENSYHGWGVQSPNGEYTLVCKDGTGVAETDEWENGMFFLVEGDELVISGDMPRPHPGTVANDGTVGILDWSVGAEEGSAFHVVTRGGTVKISKVFESSNAQHVALTPNGNFAAVTTNIPDETTYIFDVADGDQVCSFPQEVNVESQEFVEENDEWVLKIEEAPDQERKITLEGDEI